MTSSRWLGSALALLLVGCSEAPREPMVVSRSAPLIGGQPDTVTRGVVGMIVDQQSGCTGSLIAPNLVLTARHCVATINSSNGTVVCGVTNFGQPFAPSDFVVTPDDNMRDGLPASSQYGVERVVTTPGEGVCGNDVALLVLSSNIASAAAPLLVPRVDGAPTINEDFDAVGYGITDPNDTQGATFGRRLRVNALSVGCVGSSCASLGGTRTEWGANTPVCSGDSGGPALDAEGRVIGVASRGNADCDAALYGMVSSWKTLIVDTAIDAATSGGYPPPDWADPTSDAGTPEPDAGEPDAGTPEPDAGEPDAGEPDSGMPEPGTVGERCDGSCGGGLVCHQPNADNPGICVPLCSADDRTCPSRLVCSTRLGLCVPGETEERRQDDDDASGDSGGCGCRTAPRPIGENAWSLAFLVLAAFVRRRRR